MKTIARSGAHCDEEAADARFLVPRLATDRIFSRLRSGKNTEHTLRRVTVARKRRGVELKEVPSGRTLLSSADLRR